MYDAPIDGRYTVTNDATPQKTNSQNDVFDRALFRHVNRSAVPLWSTAQLYLRPVYAGSTWAVSCTHNEHRCSQLRCLTCWGVVCDWRRTKRLRSHGNSWHAPAVFQHPRTLSSVRTARH